MSRGESQAHRPKPDAQSASKSDGVEKLNFIFAVRQSHRDSIWEEQKHFTWLISIILTGQLIFFTNTRMQAGARAALILIASIVGILFSITGFRVERREGLYFSQANKQFLEEYKALYPGAEIPYRVQAVNKTPLRLMISVIMELPE